VWKLQKMAKSLGYDVLEKIEKQMVQASVSWESGQDNAAKCESTR